MSEWTIHIETPEETTRDEDLLVVFYEFITGAEAALGASARLDNERGVIGSTFQVEAETPQEAVDIGLRVFQQALTAAGVSGWARIEVEPVRELETVA